MKLNFWQRLAYYYASLVSTPGMANFHYLLLKTALRGIGILNYYDGFVSGENYFISNFLPRLVQNKIPIFFDVGANKGDYSLLLAKRFPHARIFAFEPHPKNYQALSQLDIDNFSSFALALSDTTCSMQLHDYADADGTTKATLHKDVFTEIHHKDTSSHIVKVDTLNSIVRSLNIDTVDFLKIDTEGNELPILMGGMNLLQQERIFAIQFEFDKMNVISRSFFYDFRKVLDNYSIFRLLPRGLLPLSDDPIYTELFAYQNIVAVLKDKASLFL